MLLYGPAASPGGMTNRALKLGKIPKSLEESEKCARDLWPSMEQRNTVVW